jgi:hypothetical protein
MKQGKKTNSEHIIDALRFENDLRSPEITEKVSELSGKKMKIQDIASILAKLSNSEKCDLGFFIQKKKTPRGYTYNLVPEIFELQEEEIYDLTRKTGQNRFTLEEAIEKSPGLKKYVKSFRLKQPSARRVSPQRRETGAAAAAKHGRIPKTTASTRWTDNVVQSILGQLLRGITSEGFNININVNVRFEGFVNS